MHRIPSYDDQIRLLSGTNGSNTLADAKKIRSILCRDPDCLLRCEPRIHQKL